MKEVTLRCDGGVRLGQMALGYVVLNIGDEKEILFQGFKKCGKGTSNVSEYRALIAGLIHCLKENIEIVRIIVDSQLLVKQITGAAKTSNIELLKHKIKVTELLLQFKEYSIKWEPRHKNKLADNLVNLAFTKKKKNVKK